MNLNDNQIKAINHYTGNCCVLASAGSGKTTILTHRIVNLINTYKVAPENILAITFSRKAKENMRNRISQLLDEDTGARITIETFHALGYRLLKESKYIYFNGILESWKQKQIIKDILIKNMQIEDNEENVQTNNILSFISYQKNSLIDYNEKLFPLDNMPYGIQVMKDIYQKYESAKRNENKVDFDDMLFYTYKMLNTKDKEREKYQDRYKFILIDEFQDTNHSQYEIVRLLGKKHNNVFVVGDALQNIYEWNLSNNDYIIDFYKDWIDTTVIPLNTNYRSTQDIVNISNKLVEGIKETTHEHYFKSIANKSKYKQPEFMCYEDEDTEADNIAKKILQLDNYLDVAILTRTNFQSQAIERGLYQNNIPYEIVGGKTFYEQKEIKDMISYLKLINNTTNDEAFKEIYNTPNRYLGNVFLNEVTTYAQRYKISLYESMLRFPRSSEWRYKNGITEIKDIVSSLKKRKRYKVGELIEIIRNELDYDKFISKEKYENNDKNEKIDNLDTLVSKANKYTDINTFLLEIDNLLGFTKNSNIPNRVKVMTIHKSKGLEFPIVFIPSVNSLLLPHAKSGNENEERRLFYVALTRAEKELYISSTLFYNNKDMDISPFIYDIFESDYIDSKLTKNKI